MQNRSSVKWKRQRFSKCKAVPKEAFFCDGCKRSGSKCPLRHKYKTDRARIAQNFRKQSQIEGA